MSKDVIVIGSLEHTVLYDGVAGHVRLDIPDFRDTSLKYINWNPRKNYVWIQGAIDRNATFKAISRRVDDYLWDADELRYTMYKKELDQIEGSGLQVVEDCIKFND